MNREQLCREFCDLNGIKWHHVTVEDNKLSRCSCGLTGCIARIECPKNNPDFPDAKSVLEVMMKREDWRRFQGSLCLFPEVVPVEFIMDSDKLLQKAVEWCRERER